MKPKTFEEWLKEKYPNPNVIYKWTVEANLYAEERVKEETDSQASKHREEREEVEDLRHEASWTAQQNYKLEVEIGQLCSTLREAEEGLKYYADWKKWDDAYMGDGRLVSHRFLNSGDNLKGFIKAQDALSSIKKALEKP